jgi:hypothetical protein
MIMENGNDEHSAAPPCSADLPEEFAQLVGRCEINESTFTNDEMSVALKFGQMLFRRLTRMAEHYERMSGHFMPEDIRGPMMAQAAKDMRAVVSDCVKDL